MVGEITTGFLIRVVDKFSKPMANAEKMVKRLSKTSVGLTGTLKKEAITQRMVDEALRRTTKTMEINGKVYKKVNLEDVRSILAGEEKICTMKRMLPIMRKIGTAGIALAMAAATANERFASMRLSLEAVTGSSKDAEAIFNRLRKFSEVVPIPTKQIVDTDVALIQLTHSQKEAEKITKRLAIVSSGLETNLDTLRQTYIRVTQTGRFGRAELRSFGKAMPYVIAEMRKMAKEHGKTAESFDKALVSGRFHSEWLVTALERMADKGGIAYKMMEKRNLTFMANLKELGTISSGYLDDLWKMVAGNVTLGQSFHKLNNFLRENEDRFKKVTAALHPFFAAIGKIATYTGGLIALPGMIEKIPTAIGIHAPPTVPATQTLKHHFKITVDDPKGYVKTVAAKSKDKITEYDLGTNMSFFSFE